MAAALNQTTDGALTQREGRGVFTEQENRTFAVQSLAKSASPSSASPELWPHLKFEAPVDRLTRHSQASAVVQGFPCLQYVQLSCKIYVLSIQENVNTRTFL